MKSSILRCHDNLNMTSPLKFLKTNQNQQKLMNVINSLHLSNTELKIIVAKEFR